MALTVVVALSVVVHMLIQRVRRYEEQLAGFFDSTNDRGSALICGVANYLVSGASRVARESSTDSASCDNHFDIGEKQIVVCHLLKEVRDCKFILAIPYLLSDDIDNS
jgi:membrane protein implicated in regulation of membrane protease activity